MTQPPPIAYRVDPPMVYVTTDAARPLDNSLRFSVGNVGAGPVKFANPEGLTPESRLPRIDDASSTLDRLYVWFPWGDEPGDMTTVGRASSIVASTAATNWTQPVALSDPKLGRYWILFPKSKQVFLAVDEQVPFAFEGIVSTFPAGVTEYATSLTVLLRMGSGSGPPQDLLVTKQAITATLTGTAKPLVAPAEQITLTWATSGTDARDLEPGGFRDLPEHGQQVVSAPSPPDTIVYTLTGLVPGRDAVHATTTVTSATGWLDLGAPPPNGGDRTFLFGVEDGLLLVCTADGSTWLSRDGGSWRQRARLPADNVMPLSAAVDGERVWILSPNASGSTFPVYSTTDGDAWTTQTASPNGLCAHACAAFRGSLWLLGGSATQGTSTGSSAVSYSDDDGRTWTAVHDAPWDPRCWWGAVGAAVFGEALWIVGGQDANEWCGDVWFTLDGTTWTQAPELPWGGAEGVVNLVATRGRLYALTIGQEPNMTPREGSLRLWQMDHTHGWSPVSPQPPFACPTGWWVVPAPLGMAAYADGVIVVAEHVWQYAPTPI